MTAPLPVDLLGRPAVESARIIALGFLEQAVAAAERLGDKEDPEGLHDFRVALRRLRSTLRAYRNDGCDVPKRERRLIRDLGARTNAGRDAEVQLAWLRGQSERLSARERAGLRWLVQRLEARLELEFSDMVDDLRLEFVRAERKLRRRLTHYRTRVPVGGVATEPPFSAAARAALEGAAVTLSDALSQIGGADDEEPAHLARIAAKRLRYVLEPLIPWLGEGPELLQRLKALQEGLGELHDCHVLEGALLAAASEAGAGREREIFEATVASRGDDARRLSRSAGDVRAGLTALGRLVRGRRDSLYKRLAAEWLGEEGPSFVARIEGAAANLEAPPPPLRPPPPSTPAKTRTSRRRRAWKHGGGARTGGRGSAG